MTAILLPLPGLTVAARRTLAGLALLLLGTAAAAAPISVHGRVENERGEALRDAVVRLYPTIGARAAAELLLAGAAPAPKVEAKVGAAGDFVLAAPGAGVWRLVASAPGRAARIRSWARRRRADETIFMAFVTCIVFLIERMRRFRS